MKTAEDGFPVRKFKKGDTDPNTGLIFWRRQKGKLEFLTKEKFASREIKRKEYFKKRYKSIEKNQYDTNTESILNSHKKFWNKRKLDNPVQAILCYSRNNAKRRKIFFDIREEEFKWLWDNQKGKCFYSGVDMILKVSSNSPYQVSMDRVDSSKSYTLDNVVLCCQSINFAKCHFNVDVFKDFIKDIVKSNSEQFKPKWILVTDRLPEKGDDYNIVIDLHDGGDPVSGSGEFDGIRKVFCYQGTDIEIENVTHWQHIPEPPETVKQKRE